LALAREDVRPRADVLLRRGGELGGKDDEARWLLNQRERLRIEGQKLRRQRREPGGLGERLALGRQDELDEVV
jgi:hypothetical protein